MAVLAVADPHISQARSSRTDPETVRAGMQVLYEIFGVNFIYDSSLDLDIPYRGRPMKEIIGRHSGTQDRDSSVAVESLSLCLESLFKDTGIEYEIMKKYVVLTKADSKKKPKDYTRGHPSSEPVFPPLRQPRAFLRGALTAETAASTTEA